MIRPIIQRPDPRLAERSREIDLSRLRTKEFQAFIKDCRETMDDADGIGIAAVQVGVLERMFIALRHDEPVVMINPEIIWSSEDSETDEEGCLSVRGIYAIVPRAKSVRIRFTNLRGTSEELKARGMFARILQHEYDHTNGTVIVDRALSQRTVSKREK